jgi:NAD(P)-dependent dehydrogenase (short-subunit alcohol dehydrogenase family)
MSDKKVWLVAGAGRGLGVDIAKAALAAGHAVVATGRNPEKVTTAIGESDDPGGTLVDARGYLRGPTDYRVGRPIQPAGVDPTTRHGTPPAAQLDDAVSPKNPASDSQRSTCRLV